MKEEIIFFLQTLQREMIAGFETLEQEARFVMTPWNHVTGGGGVMGHLRGSVFEKASVNWSAVSGEKFPLPDVEGPFFATGVSLITHMHNPHAPTVHFNIRYIETLHKKWLAGGYDLTPMGFTYHEDTEHFHDVAKKTLAPFGKDLYHTFSQNAKAYFYIPHREKERGVGGIFFDHYHTDHFEQDVQMWKAIGSSFLEAILPIYVQRIKMPYTQEEKELQLKMRSHYVEFNLLYDRGTQFGFRSGGNPEAILSSMPPLVKW